jgi:hypothetical protein
VPELDRDLIYSFIQQRVVRFHINRIARLDQIKLSKVLASKNPYLFRAKNILTAGELVNAILNAFLSSSEEGTFGQVLEELVIAIAEQRWGGRKSSASGLDLEFDRDGTRYVVAIKSGPNWGNQSQWERLEENFKRAIKVQRQNQNTPPIKAMLGICYGRRNEDRGTFEVRSGQKFWQFLTDESGLYLELLIPFAYQAQEYNDQYLQRRAALENRLTKELLNNFCKDDGSIDWEKLLQFNSGA